MSKLQIEYLPTDSLVPYINNPRVNDRAIDAVAGSMLSTPDGTPAPKTR